jgi:hypothetical protein
VSLTVVLVVVAYVLGWLVGSRWLPGLSFYPRRVGPKARARVPWWLVIYWRAEAGWLNGRGEGIGYTPFDAAWRALRHLWHAMRTYAEAWEK